MPQIALARRVVRSALKKGDRYQYALRLAMGQLLYRLRKSVGGTGSKKPSVTQLTHIRNGIETLAPWYQTIDFHHGLVAHATDKRGRIYPVYDADRGIAKWDRFIKPNLPRDLRNARVLEIGSNAGLFLIQSLRCGASEAIGIEQDMHYVKQASFIKNAFSELDNKPYAVQTFNMSMEDVNLDEIGYFDLCLCMSVIYHLGPGIGDNWVHSRYAHYTESQVDELQSTFLKRLGTHCQYILFQAYSDIDEGRGSGPASLDRLVHNAGLEVVKRKTSVHRRGHIVVARSPYYAGIRTFPVSRMINKYFVPVSQSAEREIVDQYRKDGAHIIPEKLIGTRYWNLRTGRNDMPDIPELFPDHWWVVPWAYLPKTRPAIYKRDKIFGHMVGSFWDLIHSIDEKGYDPGNEPIPGYLLHHPEHGSIFQCIDGNHRLGIVSALSEMDLNTTVSISIRQEIHRDKLLEYPITRNLIESGYYTEDTSYEWFDRAFVPFGGSTELFNRTTKASR